MSNRILAILLSLAFISCSGNENRDAGETGDGHATHDPAPPSDTTSADATPALPARPHDIRGEITRVGDGTPPGSIVVEENPRETSGSLKASVRLPAAAHIVRRDGETIVPLTADDLRVGMTVAAWFIGPVAESYPVQATGEYVVVE